MNITEEWRTIEEFPYHQVSNLGRVRSVIPNREKVLTLHRNKKGTFYSIHYNKITKRFHPNKLISKYWKYEFIKYLEEGEECREIKNHSNYFITSQGRVWNNWKQEWIQGYIRGGYNTILLDKTHQRVHRLVGTHFIYNPNPEKYDMVLHYYDNKLDNRVEVLRWGTNSMNQHDSVRNKTHRWSKEN